MSNIIWVVSDNIHIYAEGTIELRKMFPCIRHHLVSFEQNNIIYCICLTLLGNCMKIVFVNVVLYSRLNKIKLLPGVKKKTKLLPDELMNLINIVIQPSRAQN